MPQTTTHAVAPHGRARRSWTPRSRSGGRCRRIGSRRSQPTRPRAAGRARRPSVAPRAPRDAPCVGSPPTDAAVRPWATRGRPGYRAVRQTACRGPCAGGRQGWRVRTGSASGDGIRGLDCGAGCSAGTCACSREGSLYREFWPGTTRRSAGSEQGSPQWRRPPNGTGTTQEGQTGDPWPRSSTQVSSRHAEQSGKVSRTGCGAPEPVATFTPRPLFVIPPTFFCPTPSVPPDVTLSGSRRPRGRPVAEAEVVAVVSTYSCTGCG